MEKLLQANAEFSKFSRNYMEHKKVLPIRPSEMGVLTIITQVPGKYTPACLARMIGVSKPMITMHINVLLKKGYVSKEQAPDDKRSFFVVPTEKALLLVEQGKKDIVRQLSVLIEKMGQEDFDELVRLTAAANNIMQAAME